MAYREVTRVEIQEIIRRWQAGEGYRRIASGTGLSRNTVRKYLAAVKAEGITQDGTIPTDDHLSRLAVIGQPGPRQAETPSEDLLAPWADQIYQWLTGNRRPDITENHRTPRVGQCLCKSVDQSLCKSTRTPTFLAGGPGPRRRKSGAPTTWRIPVT